MSAPRGGGATAHIAVEGTAVRRIWRRLLVLGAFAPHACARPPATTFPVTRPGAHR